MSVNGQNNQLWFGSEWRIAVFNYIPSLLPNVFGATAEV